MGRKRNGGFSPSGYDRVVYEERAPHARQMCRKVFTLVGCLEHRTENRNQPDALAFCFCIGFNRKPVPTFGPML
jgi:hypothetical protein